MRRHLTAAEEPRPHPVARVVGAERVGEARVAEDVHEDAPVGLQPAPQPGEELAVVAHVLEHLHGEDAVEGPARIEGGDVGGQGGHAAAPRALARRGDVLGLRARVGHRRHPATWIPLGDVQRQRSPPAAQVQHVHPVLEAGALAGERQHRLLCGRQVMDLRRPQAAAVLEPRPQELGEEGRGQFVVLPVRRVLVDRERSGGELGGVAAERRRIVAARRVVEPLQEPSQAPADHAAQQRVRHAARRQGFVICHGRLSFG